jgi:hypothetical protein
VVAVNDGTIAAIGHSRKLGRFVVLEDNYGNRFTYAQLGRLAKAYAVPKRQKLSASDFKLVTPNDKKPTQPATRGKPLGAHGGRAKASAKEPSSQAKSSKGPVNTQDLRPRLYALPDRAHNRNRAGIPGQLDQLLSRDLPGFAALKSYLGGDFHLDRGSMELRRLRKGSKVEAGTVLGHIGKTTSLAPHVNFAIQPAGKGSPKIDPKPILDGWKLLEATSIYRAAGRNPFTTTSSTTRVIQDLLMSKNALERRALADPRLSIYQCGRNDIKTGQVDRRVLAAMEYLADNGFRLEIRSLKCGHGKLASSNASGHSTGDAMDIAAIGGVPVRGHQGRGTLSDDLIQTVLRLQGVMEPQKVVSHRNLPGPVSVAASGPRGDHVDIAWSPVGASGYVSPFVHAIEGRIDQGVDYVGTGPINAIGNARILNVGAPGWPNGGAGPAGQGVLYRLLGGSQAGRVIFVYEGITPTVHPGEEVVAGQRIGKFYPGSSIEIGFADASGVPLSHSIYHEGMETPWGKRMHSFLHSIGAPGKLRSQFSELLQPGDWDRVIERIGKIKNPTVPTSPSRYSVPAGKHASAKRQAGRGR